MTSPSSDPAVIKAYLEKDIVPHVYKGLTELVREMPDDPYSWLAEWLHKTNPLKKGQGASFVQELVKELKTGDYFGEIALLSNKPRQVTVKAVGPTTVLYLDRDAFNRLCGSMFDILARNMKDYEEMVSGLSESKALQDEQEQKEAQKAELQIQAEMEEDKKENEDDAASLAPLPSGPRVKQKAAKRQRGSVFTATVTADANWKPPVVPKSESDKSRLGALINKSAFLSKLDSAQQQMVVDAFETDKVPSGTNIITQGEEGDFFYMLDTGRADVFVSKPEWPEPKKVTEYISGGTFGELALLHDDKRAATVTCTQDCSVWKLGRDTFKKIMQVTGANKVSAHEKFLEKVQILSTLSKYERFRLAESMKSKQFNDGDDIIKEGDAGDEFFLIEKGAVKCYKRVLRASA